ncbi:MAG: hypothetical protein EP330_08465 [Deltaproteobacteria bacterium]|nr:MAG: hypothetical protein EP330_08465 [Deltaproteobacteria bacterium]
MSFDGVLFGRARGTWSADDRLDIEADALEELGVPYAMVALDDLVNGDTEGALAALPPARGRRWLYRGWLLSLDEYEALYEAVSDRGDQLVVTPTEFEEALYAPFWIEALGSHTPESVWTDDSDAREAWTLAMEELGPPPWVIKDHVKSAKERWQAACFVPEGCDEARFAEICEALVDIRGDRFERGLVVRRFVDLAPIGFRTEAREAMDEHRLVFYEGRLVAHAPYFDEEGSTLPADQMRWIGEAVESSFFVADVARLAEGGWTVIEINDGGCATLPETMDPRRLYRRMLDTLVR